MLGREHKTTPFISTEFLILSPTLVLGGALAGPDLECALHEALSCSDEKLLLLVHADGADPEVKRRRALALSNKRLRVLDYRRHSVESAANVFGNFYSILVQLPGKVPLIGWLIQQKLDNVRREVGKLLGFHQAFLIDIAADEDRALQYCPSQVIRYESDFQGVFEQSNCIRLIYCDTDGLTLIFHPHPGDLWGHFQNWRTFNVMGLNQEKLRQLMDLLVRTLSRTGCQLQSTNHGILIGPRNVALVQTMGHPDLRWVFLRWGLVIVTAVLLGLLLAAHSSERQLVVLLASISLWDLVFRLFVSSTDLFTIRLFSPVLGGAIGWIPLWLGASLFAIFIAWTKWY